MKKIIFTNQIKRLKTQWNWSAERPLYCFIPKDTQQTEEVAQFLRGRPGVCWVDRDRIFQQKRERFEQDYVRFMAKLNVNNHSFIWWTMNFTSKNPLSTDLIFKVFCFFCVVDLAGKLEAELLVITDDLLLYRQVQIWSREKGVEAVNDIRKRRDWKDWLRFLGPAELCYDFLRLVLYHHWAKQICNWKPTPGVTYVAITSLIYRQSFKGDGRYWDAYFGELQSYFEREGIPVFLFGKFIEKRRDYRNMVQRVAKQVNFIPVDYYQSYLGLAKCWLICMYYYFFTPKVRGPVVMYDCDLQYLIKQAVRGSFRRNTALCNMQEYYNVRAMMGKVQLGRYLYPFENRCFEKMMVLGVRSMDSRVQTCGFQHTVVTHKHTNFFLSREEIKTTPLPDEIITPGHITRNLLIQMGNFPPDKIRVGCALRQNPKPLGKIQPRGSQKIRNVLVILAESVEEYVRSLLFLDRALEGNDAEIILTLRAHPTIPLEKALQSCPPLHFHYAEQKGVPLDKALQEADVVIYTSSTVGIEAVSRGIPVIFLDLGDFLDPDPLFLLDTFKWRVCRPEEFLTAIREIEKLPEAEFKKAQAAAKVFAACG